MIKISQSGAQVVIITLMVDPNCPCPSNIKLKCMVCAIFRDWYTRLAHIQAALHRVRVLEAFVY